MKKGDFIVASVLLLIGIALYVMTMSVEYSVNGTRFHSYSGARNEIFETINEEVPLEVVFMNDTAYVTSDSNGEMVIKGNRAVIDNLFY
jgi:hypothetical protein